MTPSYPHLSIDQPGVYRILVQGWLSEAWEDWFEGMHLTPGDSEQPSLPDPAAPQPIETTLLTGEIPDQAALLSLLQKLYSFNLPILSLKLVLNED